MSQNLQLLPLKSLTAPLAEVSDTHKATQVIDTDDIKKAFQLTKSSYKRTRTVACQPFPIPATGCIPTMASAEQTELYEAQFIGVPCVYLENRTISDLLKIYSFSEKQIPIGKINFLGSFFQKITTKNISLDVVILCRDLQSQKCLAPILKAIGLNCDHLTSHSDRPETFGVVVKIRKANKPITPIKQATNVDLVLVYDSAIGVSKRVLNQFKGVDYDRPLIADITTIDSADIRCYHNPTVHKQYNWGTKYKNVQEAQEVFHQSNRHPERQHFFAWNDYVATEVAGWVALKHDIPYRFYRPSKNHPAIKGYRSWGGGHPLSGTPVRVDTPLVTAEAPKAPNAPNSCTATASPGAATKSKKKQKVKEEVQQKAVVPSPSSNVSTLPLVASTSAARPDPASAQPFSSSPPTPTPMQIDPAPSTIFASANVEHSTNALTSNVGSADPIAQGLDYIPLLSDSRNQEPLVGDKRAIEEDSLIEPPSPTKRAKSDTNTFMPAFNFTSILDEALRKFEEQMNSLKTKI